MLTRSLSVAVYAAVIVTVLLIGRRAESRVLTGGELLARAMKTRKGRTCAILFWIWVGWHFFGR